MLARSLERTGGPEEDGVRMFKDELRESVLKKDSNRLGDFEDNEFYLCQHCAIQGTFFLQKIFLSLCKHPFLHQRSPLRLIFNDFCHSGLKTCFS